MAELFRNIPVKRNGSDETLNGYDALNGKLVALYFSAHWCPPCRKFTPVLKDFYEEVTSNEQFEIVFVSSDRNASDLQAYLNEAHGKWLYIPYGDKNIQTLGTKYGVSGIPVLAVVKPDGTAITLDGRSDVQNKAPNAAISAWKAKL
ncbi:thioredoxin-like domain-containing protein [Ditylenchus destructor]|uniref:protein-disulfide reductase n=1 Tax=Ditylenchus destructor TaxID=166010 RepID=A0AAD4ML86_9BILA|nr:thioredoxin-like domain-containing protein [Ditylenchus destructor]